MGPALVSCATGDRRCDLLLFARATPTPVPTTVIGSCCCRRRPLAFPLPLALAVLRLDHARSGLGFAARTFSARASFRPRASTPCASATPGSASTGIVQCASSSATSATASAAVSELAEGGVCPASVCSCVSSQSFSGVLRSGCSPAAGPRSGCHDGRRLMADSGVLKEARRANKIVCGRTSLRPA